MENICHFVTENFSILFGFSVIWCVACFTFFAWQRARRGAWHPPVLTSLHSTREHQEGWANLTLGSWRRSYWIRCERYGA